MDKEYEDKCNQNTWNFEEGLGTNICQIFIRGPGQLLQMDSSSVKWELCR